MKTITKNFLPVILLTLLISITVNGQGITIGTGTTFTLGSSTTLSLTGNWTDSGTFTAGTGSTVIFDGPSGNETVSGAETFDNLTINKSADSVVLSNNIIVNGALTVTSGNLNLNNHSCSLGSSAMLSETAGNEVMGGTISITKTLNTPASINAGGLGAEITSNANLGNTTITRGSAIQTGNGNNSSIKRYYDITPANNTGLNAELVFHYDPTVDLNGLTESTLRLFKSTDSGKTWADVGGKVDTIAHTVTLSGITSFSRWTLGSTVTSLPIDDQEVLPKSFRLYQNYPNPFNPTTVIRYKIPKDGMVSIKLYDALGSEVSTLVSKNQQAGRYEITFNASELASGIYFYRINVNGDKGQQFTSIKKMILLK